MANLAGFNAAEVPVATSGVLLAGRYTVIATESEMKDTKANDGSQYLQFTLDILDEGSEGRKLWVRLNLVNKSTVAVNLAKSDLARMCEAIGILTPDDSKDLHNIPFCVDVEVVQKKDKTGEENKIVKFLKVGSEEAPPVGKVAQLEKAAAAASTSTPAGAAKKPAPWTKDKAAA